MVPPFTPRMTPAIMGPRKSAAGSPTACKIAAQTAESATRSDHCVTGDKVERPLARDKTMNSLPPNLVFAASKSVLASGTTPRQLRKLTSLYQYLVQAGGSITLRAPTPALCRGIRAERRDAAAPGWFR